MSQQRFCANCSAANQEANRFCVRCGAPLSPPPQTPTTSLVRATGVKVRRLGKAARLGAILALVASVLCFLVYITYSFVSGFLPAGGQIAYLTEAKQKMTLHVVNADASARIEIETGADNIAYLWDPLRQQATPLSPSGRYLTYVARQQGRYALHSFDTQTRQSKKLVADVEGLTGSFAAESDRVLYRIRRSGTWNLGWIDLATSQIRELPNAVGTAIADISVDGRRVVYTGSESGQTTLYLADIGSDSKILVRGIADGWGTFLPDGRLVLAVQKNRGEPFKVYHAVEEIERQDPAFVIAGLSNLNWTRDGARFAFVARAKGSTTLFLQARDASERIELASNFDTTLTQFSPDGRWLVFRAQSGERYDCYFAATDGRSLTRLVEGATTWPITLVSPNSQWLAINALTGSGATLFLLNPAQGIRATLVDGVEEGGRASFAPDSKKIVFDEKQGGIWTIYIADVASGQKAKLADEGFAPVWSR
jgi:Tol biopolymer transport system component